VTTDTNKVRMAGVDKGTHQHRSQDELDDVDEAGVDLAQAVGAVLVAVGCGGRGGIAIAVGDELCGKESSEEADGVEVESDLEAQLEAGHCGDVWLPAGRLCWVDDASGFERGKTQSSSSYVPSSDASARVVGQPWRRVFLVPAPPADWPSPATTTKYRALGLHGGTGALQHCSTGQCLSAPTSQPDKPIRGRLHLDLRLRPSHPLQQPLDQSLGYNHQLLVYDSIL